jgi:hypothetical protein
MRRWLYSAALAGAAVLGAAVPVMADSGGPVRFVSDESWTIDHACGVVEETTLHAEGKAFFDTDGAWLRDILVYSVEGVFSGPGGSLTTTSHQVGEFTPETGTFRGQGVFIRGGRIGVLVYDVGRLVFDAADGSTLFATPKVIRYDDPSSAAAIDAALCQAIG